jgi:hypothetical protein
MLLHHDARAKWQGVKTVKLWSVVFLYRDMLHHICY